MRVAAVPDITRSVVPRVVATMLFLASFASAEIFQRNAGNGVAKGLGFTEVYSAPVEVNGGKGRVDVWHSESGFFQTMSRIQDACRARGWPEGFSAGENMGFGMAVDGQTLVRYLVVRVPDGTTEKSLVYETTQTLAEFNKGGEPVREHRLDKLPVLDQSEAVSFIEDGNTHTAIEVSRSRQPAEFILGWFDQRMAADGWATAVLTVADARMYTRGKERAVVNVQRDKDGRALISRMHKVEE